MDVAAAPGRISIDSMSSSLRSAARLGEGAPDSTASPRVTLLMGTPSTTMTGWGTVGENPTWTTPNDFGPRIKIAVEAPASPLPWFVSTFGTLPASAWITLDSLARWISAAPTLVT